MKFGGKMNVTVKCTGESLLYKWNSLKRFQKLIIVGLSFGYILQLVYIWDMGIPVDATLFITILWSGVIISVVIGLLMAFFTWEYLGKIAIIGMVLVYLLGVVPNVILSSPPNGSILWFGIIVFAVAAGCILFFPEIKSFISDIRGENK